MPKRSNSDKIDKYREKIRKLQEKEQVEQQRKRRRILEFSDSDENSDNEYGNNEEIIQDIPSNDDLLATDTVPSVDQTSETVADQTTEPAPGHVVEEASEPNLDPEILSALGESTEEAPKFGEKIHQKLANLWLPILRKGLNKEAKEKLTKEVLIPENCTLLQAPKLNPEISAAVSEVTKHKDKRVESVQQQLGLGISVLNKGLSLLLEADTDKVLAIKHLSDSCRILCDLHFVETEARKKMVTPGMDKAFLNLIQDVDRDETLFGNKLSEKIKASRAIEKQGLQIKKAPPAPKPSTSTSSTNSRTRSQGNWTGPPRYSSNRGGRGGSRKPTQSSRKTAQPYQPKTSTTSKQPRAPSQQQ